MKFIAHRGNLNLKHKDRENAPSYIKEALEKGFDVEIDVWNIHGKWKLGHDEPVYDTDESFIQQPGLWVHAKNEDALIQLNTMKDVNYFWHDKDDYTLTSKGFIWCQMGVPVLKGSICVMPEKRVYGDIKQCYGVCSDIIEYWKQVW